jgi:hypothetical protein
MANPWEKVVRYGVLVKDLATLHGYIQNKGLHRLCLLEVFWNATKGLSKTTEMAQHLGITRCGVNSQAKSEQCIPDALSQNEEF